MLEVRDLSCTRDERLLFSDLNFCVESGELVQIEGRNGAGKTTLLRIIAGLGLADSGEIIWRGEPVVKSRDIFHSDLLFLGHSPGVKRELTAFENLEFYQAMHGQKDSDAIWHALAKVGLAGREDVSAGQLSAGQHRRVALARLWLSKSPLWILDEPLTAIDKQGVKVLEALFQKHVSEGGIVLFTTHQDMFEGCDNLRRIKLGNA